MCFPEHWFKRKPRPLIIPGLSPVREELEDLEEILNQ